MPTMLFKLSAFTNADALTTGSGLSLLSSSSPLIRRIIKCSSNWCNNTSRTHNEGYQKHADAGIACFEGDAPTVGKAVTASADALTTGSALDITSSSADKTTGALVNIALDWCRFFSSSQPMKVTTAAVHADAGVACFEADVLSVGKAVTVSADGLTGSALDITSSSTGKTGALVNIAQTGATLYQLLILYQ